MYLYIHLLQNHLNMGCSLVLVKIMAFLRIDGDDLAAAPNAEIDNTNERHSEQDLYSPCAPHLAVVWTFADCHTIAWSDSPGSSHFDNNSASFFLWVTWCVYA